MNAEHGKLHTLQREWRGDRVAVTVQRRWSEQKVCFTLRIILSQCEISVVFDSVWCRRRYCVMDLTAHQERWQHKPLYPLEAWQRPWQTAWWRRGKRERGSEETESAAHICCRSTGASQGNNNQAQMKITVKLERNILGKRMHLWQLHLFQGIWMTIFRICHTKINVI